MTDAFYSCEAIGLTEARELRTFFGPGGPHAHWCALITGPDDKYGFGREFLSPRYDYANANSTGNRGVRATWTLTGGFVYEVSHLITHRSRHRAFFLARDGEAAEISREEALEMITAPDYADRIAALKEPPPAPATTLPATADAKPVDHRNDKRPIGVSVLAASRARISWTFDRFERVYLSFSAGKDSTVMLHLAAEEARKRGRRFGLLLIDLEAQYNATVTFGQAMFDRYADVIDPYWIALPLSLRNAVSMAQPQWMCWDPKREADWVRHAPAFAYRDAWDFPFFRTGMEFEDFVDRFGEWYGKGKSTACLVGIRSDESLNRWRAIVRDHARHNNKPWTTVKHTNVVNVYPIYDWRVQDIWTYHGKTGLPHNPIYDLMHRAGLTLSQMRICQPYGDDQRKGLWLYHILEPETWPRVLARVEGANSGALHARDTGNMTGVGKITLPEGHTWESFAKSILASLPAHAREHYDNKIAVFIKWYRDRGYPDGLPDEADPKEEAARRVPSWRRICKTLLRNDWWCRGLSFTQHKSGSYENYLKIMRNRRRKWMM